MNVILSPASSGTFEQGTWAKMAHVEKRSSQMKLWYMKPRWNACFLERTTYFFCSQTCIQSHDTNLKTIHKVQGNTQEKTTLFSPEPRGFWKWSAVARKRSPPRCCIKAHSSWCWQCAEGKPGLKEKCWEPQEPQRTSDCSAIILPRLSYTWKEKQKLHLSHSV